MLKNRFISLAVVVLASHTLVGTAQADTGIGGTARGVTVSTGGDTFKMSGTYTDPNVLQGFGLYRGSYIYVTTGFTTCRDNLGQNCVGDIWSHCNVVSGQITFQSGLNLVTVNFSNFPFHGLDVVCQLPGTTTHALSLPLSNLWAPSDNVSRGYGPLFQAHGIMSGTSVPLRNGVYADTFDVFGLLLESATP